jgi:hypothetical protein
MKRKCVLVMIMLLLVCFSATPLFAGPFWGKKAQHADRNKDGSVDKKEVKMERKWEHGQKAKVNTPREVKMDANKDGVVNPAEANRAHQAWKAKTDSNQDGVVDTTERQQARQQRLEKKAQVDRPWEAKADTNRDGVLDSTEAAQARQQFKNKVDLNHDGTIDPKERRSAEGWQHSKRKVNTEAEKKHDGNGDGWIDATEARQMMQDRKVLVSTEGKAKVNTLAEDAADANKDGIVDPAEAKTLVS